MHSVNTSNISDITTVTGQIVVNNELPVAKISAIKAHTPSFDKYTVTGTVTDKFLDYYDLELCNKDHHVNIFNTLSVDNDTLGVFNTEGFADGVYLLRLTAYDHSENSTVYEMPLVIDRSSSILKINIDSVTQNMDMGSDGYIPTSDDPDVWIEDDLPAGSLEMDNWQWDTGRVYSGSRSHTNTSVSGVQGHYFIHAFDSLLLDSIENIIQYIYIDPLNPVQEILIQFYTDDGDGEHRAYWGVI